MAGSWTPEAAQPGTYVAIKKEPSGTIFCDVLLYAAPRCAQELGRAGSLPRDAAPAPPVTSYMAHGAASAPPVTSYISGSAAGAPI
eukprot:gene10589-biopygen6518